MKSILRNAQTRLLDYCVQGSVKASLEARADYLTSLFAKDIPEASRILDIGGHWGFYVEPLERLGHRPVVLDVVRPGFQKAPVVIYDGSKMPFEDKSFDVSLLITVLHHIRDQEAVLREACRVTKKRIIVIEDLYHHAAGRLWTILRDRFYNFEWVGHPCGFRTKAGWYSFFGEQGLSVVRCEEVVTRLCGLRILNGLFVLEAAA